MSLRAVILALTLGLAATAAADDWPQWRGPNRDGVSKETGLLKSWPKDGPPKAWTAKGLGGGHGSPIVVARKIFALGKKGNNEVAVCLRESDGSPVWEKTFNTLGKEDRVDRNVGPRSTPTYRIDPKLGPVVYALGVTGTLACLKADSGEILWEKSYTKDFKGRINGPNWGYSESVLVDGDRLVCTPGGEDAAVVALKPDTGEVIWKTPANVGGGNGYSSPVKAEVGGIPMYVVLLGKTAGLVGIHAQTGKVLWQYNKAALGGTAQIPTPIAKGDLVWFSTAYGGGSALLRFVPKGKDQVTVTEVQTYPGKKLANHHGGMVLVGDYVYFGHEQNQGQPVCVEFKTGRIVWGPVDAPVAEDNRKAGSAAVIAADGMLYFRYQNHTLALVEASPAGLKLVSKFTLPEWSGVESWSHPVIANGKLYIRDQNNLYCYNVKAATN